MSIWGSGVAETTTTFSIAVFGKLFGDQLLFKAQVLFPEPASQVRTVRPQAAVAPSDHSIILRLVIKVMSALNKGLKFIIYLLFGQIALRLD